MKEHLKGNTHALNSEAHRKSANSSHSAALKKPKKEAHPSSPARLSAGWIPRACFACNTGVMHKEAGWIQHLQGKKHLGNSTGHQLTPANLSQSASSPRARKRPAPSGNHEGKEQPTSSPTRRQRMQRVGGAVVDVDGSDAVDSGNEAGASSGNSLTMDSLIEHANKMTKLADELQAELVAQQAKTAAAVELVAAEKSAKEALEDTRKKLQRDKERLEAENKARELTAKETDPEMTEILLQDTLTYQAKKDDKHAEVTARKDSEIAELKAQLATVQPKTAPTPAPSRRSTRSTTL
jgi:hypothetical protein